MQIIQPSAQPPAASVYAPVAPQLSGPGLSSGCGLQAQICGSVQPWPATGQSCIAAQPSPLGQIMQITGCLVGIVLQLVNYLSQRLGQLIPGAASTADSALQNQASLGQKYLSTAAGGSLPQIFTESVSPLGFLGKLFNKAESCFSGTLSKWLGADSAAGSGLLDSLSAAAGGGLIGSIAKGAGKVVKFVSKIFG